MATAIMGRLRYEALNLPERERAGLARELIESLDAPGDEGVEEAWDREIARRLAQIDEGQAKLVDLEELRKSIVPTLSPRG